MASENVIELTEANFEQEVVKSEVPVFVDFWASWCGPCKMSTPSVEQIADEMKGKIKVGKVNVDENNALAGKFGIQSIPTFLLFKAGQVVESLTGFNGKQGFVSLIEKHL